MLDKDEPFEEENNFIKIEVEGDDKTLWKQFKSKLSILLLELLDSKINQNTGATVNDEIKKAASNLLDFANAKLEKPSLENEKLVVEIEKILAEKAKTVAETRKLNAEAEKMEIENTLQKLKTAIGLAKIIGQSNSDSEFILFVKNIEDFTFIFQENKALK